MRLLASAGVLTEGDKVDFGLTPVGECLRVGVPGSSRAMVMLFAGNRIQQLWKDLEYCVRTGEPAYRLRGLTDPFLDPLRTPDEEASFDAAMADFTRLAAMAIASVYDFSPFNTVVDMGGGNGALMIGILKANPRLRASFSTNRRRPNEQRLRFRKTTSPNGARRSEEIFQGSTDRRRCLSSKACHSRLG